MRGPGGFAAQLFDRRLESSVGTARLQFQEPAIRPALLFQVAERCDRAVFQDQHLAARLFDIPQQVRGDHQVHGLRVANLTDQFDHALARGRVQSIRRLIQKQQFRAMRDRLRQLHHLLHASRIGAEVPVADFAEANIEARLVRTFHRLVRR